MTIEEIKKSCIAIGYPEPEYKQMEYKSRTHEILFEGKYCGYEFYIINYGSHPCAYVRIPRESKLFGKTYIELYDEDIDINVHGGLTYSNYYLRGVNEEGTSWFIGWDYAHCNDYTYFECVEIDKHNSLFENNKKWTTEEIFKHVTEVIDQIMEIER